MSVQAAAATCMKAARRRSCAHAVAELRSADSMIYVHRPAMDLRSCERLLMMLRQQAAHSCTQILTCLHASGSMNLQLS
jgi:hypothetical protein